MFKIDLSRISIVSLFILSFYIFIYAGLPIAYFGFERIGSTLIKYGNYTVYKVFIYIFVSHILFICGVVFGRRIKLNSSSGSYFLEEKINPHSLKFLGYMGFLFCLLSFANYVQRIGIDQIALLRVLDIVSTDIAATKLRSLTSTEYDFGSYTLIEFMNRQLSMFCAVLIVFTQIRFPHKRSKVIIFIVVLIQFLILVSNTEQLPVISFLLMLFIAYKFTRGNYTIEKREMLGIFVFFIMLIFGMFFLFVATKDNTVEDIFSGLFSRLFVAQMQGCYHIFELFPAKFEFLKGAGLSNPFGLLPINQVDLNWIITTAYDVQALDINSPINTLPTYFAADAYANFGELGWLFFSFIYGTLLSIFDKLLYQRVRNPFFLTLYIWAIVHCKDLVGTGISALIFDHSFMILIFLSILYSLLVYKRF